MLLLLLCVVILQLTSFSLLLCFCVVDFVDCCVLTVVYFIIIFVGVVDIVVDVVIAHVAVVVVVAIGATPVDIVGDTASNGNYYAVVVIISWC